MIMKTKKRRVVVTRTGRRLVIAFAIGLGMCLTSCNVTRSVTTQSEYFQRGDTAVHITTKTIESYDATKKYK